MPDGTKTSGQKADGVEETSTAGGLRRSRRSKKLLKNTFRREGNSTSSRGPRSNADRFSDSRPLDRDAITHRKTAANFLAKSGPVIPDYSPVKGSFAEPWGAPMTAWGRQVTGTRIQCSMLLADCFYPQEPHWPTYNFLAQQAQ